MNKNRYMYFRNKIFNTGTVERIIREEYGKSIQNIKSMYINGKLTCDARTVIEEENRIRSIMAKEVDGIIGYSKTQFLQDILQKPVTNDDLTKYDDLFHD